ncbi:MAG: LPS assembly protein LptD [Alphaproteobacteria bacterium]
MRGAAALAILAAALAAAAPLQAQPARTLKSPVLLSAQAVDYDQQSGLIAASGAVELIQGDRVLLADRVTYNERTGRVTASGEVVIMEPSGEVLFADRVELEDELKSGVVEGIRMLFADDSRLAAAGARRSGGDRTELAKAVFSPCELCDEDRDRAPLWQIKANRVVHKQKAQRVDYYDAWLEVFGVPVFYTPFFTHPDPTVKRKTGFLTPDYGSSSILGLTLRTPFYLNLAADKDVTITPLFTSKEGVALFAEYRQRLSRGQFQFDGSVTRPDARGPNGERLPGAETRGHIFGTGRFDIDRTWRWGFDLRRASDDTYLRRYDISHADTLASNLFVEGFRGRNYAAANVHSFQGLRAEDDFGLTPIVWPILEYSFVGQPSRLGGRYNLDVSAMQLTRSEGTDSRRLSLAAGWRLPYTAPAGDIYSLYLSLRGDLYLVDGVVDPAAPGAGTFGGVTGRFRPLAAFDWRYPFVRNEGATRQIVEPIASFVISPFGGNPSEIPNEDSVSFEFDDTNLFSYDRFPGLDRVEDGVRLNLGVKAGVYGSRGGSSTIFLGQTFRAGDGDTFAERTGLDSERSDYVGRLTISPTDWLDFVYRFRLDRDNFGFQRNEIDLALGPPSWRLNVGFVSLSSDLSAAEATTRREIRATGFAQLTERWSAQASWRRDLGDDGGNISAAFGVLYEGQCVRFSVGVRRSFTRDRDVEPSTSINLRISLKYLG